MGSGQQFVLKVFSGPHQGAEALLAEGSYSIGSDDECDIVLSDPEVAPRHVRLTIDRETARLGRTGEQTFFVDGKATGADEIEIAPGQVFTLGSTHLGLAREGDDRPHIRLPERSGPEPVEPPKETGGESLDEPPKAGPPAGPPAGRSTRRFLAATALLLFALVAVLVWGLSGFVERDGPTERQETAQRVQALLDEMRFDSLKVMVDGEGSVAVRGYLPSSDGRRTLLEALRKVNAPMRIDVWVDEEIRESAGKVVSGSGTGLTVEAVQNGRLKLVGWVDEESRLDGLMAALRADVVGIASIETDVLTREALISRLSQMLKETGLDRRIRLRGEPGRIVAEGNVSGEERSAWVKVKESFLAGFGRYVSLKDGVETVAAPERREAPDLKVKAVVVGDVRYITGMDGRKYFEGATLPDGLAIKRIDHDRIVLVGGSEEIVVPLGGAQ